MCPAMLSAIALLLHWVEVWTIINELLVVWLGIVQPPLAVYWLLRERQFRRPDADGPQ